jgi:ethanolamine ammonia-lyase large subunit
MNLALLDEAHAAALSLRRGTVGDNCHVLRNRPGQRAVGQCPPRRGPADAGGPRLRRGARYKPLLVNTVVGFIGPEYLYDGKQIIRAGLEDHFCGKLLGLPMGCDICYTNHAEADSDDMDTLLVLLGAAGVNFIMGVPGADDVMLNYQSTSFHDALFVRQLLGLQRAPEFEAWLQRQGLTDGQGRLLPPPAGLRWPRASARCWMGHPHE